MAGPPRGGGAPAKDRASDPREGARTACGEAGRTKRGGRSGADEATTAVASVAGGAGDGVAPADGGGVVGVVDLGRAVAGGGRGAEVVPLGPVAEEDPDRLAAGRAVRLGAMGDAAEGRGAVAGQERQGHRHLLDIEQSQPVKPGSPLGVGLRPELINGQRTFHTKILSTRVLAATTDAPPARVCRDQSATNLRP